MLYKYERPGDVKHGTIFKYESKSGNADCWKMKVVKSNGNPSITVGKIIGCYINCLKPMGQILNK